jgi:hypothetical protein
MPETAINPKSATGCLLVLIPAALTMSALFVAWPFILGVTLLIAGGNIWQSYEWSKTARSIDPVFQQLVVQNRGEISPIDLSVSAKVAGKVANKYLAIRADEFGTGSRQHPERGQVYYFISVSTLGTIFDDSEVESPALMPATTPVVALNLADPSTEMISNVSVQPELVPAVAASLTPVVPVKLAIPAPELPVAVTIAETPPLPVITEIRSDATRSPEPPAAPAILEIAEIPILPVVSPPAELLVDPQPEPPLALENVADLSNLRQLFDQEQPAPIATPIIVELEEQLAIATTPAAPTTDRPVVIIIQSELAKRLDVHPSTIYKRRSEPGFTDWTRNRDPEGLAWGYAEVEKEYYQIFDS